MREDGREPPEAIMNAQLDDQLVEFWRAFNLLSSCRTSSFASVNPISVQEIDAYLSVCGITDIEDRMDYLIILRGLDNHFMHRESERMERERKKRDGRNPKPKH